MEGTVVQMLRLPQLVLALDIGNGLSGFVVLDDPGRPVQRLLAGEHILRRNLRKNQYQRMVEEAKSYKWIRNDQKVLGAIGVSGLRVSRLINVDSLWH